MINKNSILRVTNGLLIASLFTFSIALHAQVASTTASSTTPTTPSSSTASGCTSMNGYSTTNGQPCNGTNTATNTTSGSTTASTNTNGSFPAGCTSNNGFSSITGASCMNSLSNNTTGNNANNTASTTTGTSINSGTSNSPSLNNGTTSNTASSTLSGMPFCEIQRTLKLGTTGEDVRCLQRFLNYEGYIISRSGAGSPGNESTYFGPATERAVAQWQDANMAQVLSPEGLTSGTGIFGPLSFDYYVTLVTNALLGNSNTSSGNGNTSSTTPTTPNTTTTTNPTPNTQTSTNNGTGQTPNGQPNGKY